MTTVEELRDELNEIINAGFGKSEIRVVKNEHDFLYLQCTTDGSVFYIKGWTNVAI